MSVAAYPFFALIPSVQQIFNFSKSYFVLFFYFTLSSPKTNSGDETTFHIINCKPSNLLLYFEL